MAADSSRLVVLRRQRSCLQNCCASDWQRVLSVGTAQLSDNDADRSCYVVDRGVAKCDWGVGDRRSLKATGNGTIRKLAYGLLFASHSNYGRIFSRLNTIHECDTHSAARHGTTARIALCSLTRLSRAAKTSKSQYTHTRLVQDWYVPHEYFNPLMGTGTYSPASNW